MKMEGAPTGWDRPPDPMDVVPAPPATRAPPMDTTSLPRHACRCGDGIVHIPNRWRVLKDVASTTRTIVVTALDTKLGKQVCVKKRASWEGSCLPTRELKLLRLMRHFDGVCCLIDIAQPSDDRWTDLYTVHEYGGCTLQRYLRYSSNKPTARHGRYWAYQLLRTLKYLHSSGIVHGNIEPRKILVTQQGDVKLCDLGRCVVEGFEVTGDSNGAYAPPEELIVPQRPSAKGDVWSVGCIYAEILEGNGPLFAGTSHEVVLAAICARVGRPAEGLLQEMAPGDMSALRRFVLEQEPVPGLPTGDSTSPYFRAAFPLATADSDALQCIATTLRFDPRARTTAEGALQTLKLFGRRSKSGDPALFNPRDEPRAPFSAFRETAGLREAGGAGARKLAAWAEVLALNPDIHDDALRRAAVRPPGAPPGILRLPPGVPPAPGLIPLPPGMLPPGMGGQMPPGHRPPGSDGLIPFGMLPPGTLPPGHRIPPPGLGPDAKEMKKIVLINTANGPQPCIVVPGGVKPIFVPPDQLQKMVEFDRRQRAAAAAAAGLPQPPPAPPTVLVPPGQPAPPGTVMVPPAANLHIVPAAPLPAAFPPAPPAMAGLMPAAFAPAAAAPAPAAARLPAAFAPASPPARQ